MRVPKLEIIVKDGDKFLAIMEDTQPTVLIKITDIKSVSETWSPGGPTGDQCIIRIGPSGEDVSVALSFERVVSFLTENTEKKNP